jgi:hypothetical protein
LIRIIAIIITGKVVIDIVFSLVETVGRNGGFSFKVVFSSIWVVFKIIDKNSHIFIVISYIAGSIIEVNNIANKIMVIRSFLVIGGGCGGVNNYSVVIERRGWCIIVRNFVFVIVVVDKVPVRFRDPYIVELSSSFFIIRVLISANKDLVILSIVMDVWQIEFFFVGIPAEVSTIVVIINIEYLVVRIIAVGKFFFVIFFIIIINFFFRLIFVKVSVFWTRIS